ncbi:MAG: SDR family NAD(P)-dependent oxidoreductase [Myxococcota bacterium]
MKGRRALVTGASRGIGPYIARALADEGVHVALTARSPEPLEALASEIRERGVDVHVITADLSERDERARLVEEAESALGAVDILVNNAGLESEGAFACLDAETIERTVTTNLVAPMHLTRLVLPAMGKLGRGHIVNMASIGGKKGAPYDALYSGTKAGLVEWSNALRIELEGTGVSVSVICPGFVTEVGMFAKFGVTPPASLGSCTAPQVARAVVHVVQTNRAEIIVNSTPIRPLLMLYALFPGVAGWLFRLLGVTEFQRRKVGAEGPLIASRSG